MEESTKILLCEDDESLGMLLREYLQAKGYETVLATDGEEGLRQFLSDSFTICVFDVMMPKMDGFTLAKEIRQSNVEIPIVFLTAKNLKDDIVEGFRLGADDYITKPFSMEELVMRIEAILRRVNSKKIRAQVVYKIGRFTFDSNKHTLSAEGIEPRKLTTKESDLLALLCMHHNDVLSRAYALKKVWMDDNYFNARSMDVYITKLRKYLREDPEVEIINIHGKGYKLITPDETDEATSAS